MTDVGAAPRTDAEVAAGSGVKPTLVQPRSGTSPASARWKPSRRLTGALLAVALALVVAIAAIALWPRDEARLTGTDLGAQVAPSFTLTDQRGATVSLSDLKGKAVALTFIYTSCPDVCPLIAEKLRWAYDALPADQRDDVALLAVTVDPETDTAAALTAFSEAHQLGDNPDWHALRADRATLEAVWLAYGVYGGSAGIGHTDAVYVIDPQGRERVFMRSDFDAEALVRNLQAVLE